MKKYQLSELRQLFQKFTGDTMRDIAVEGRDEFQQNFRREAFFSGSKWARRKYDPDPERKILHKRGFLKKSITSRIEGEKIIYETVLPYAAIHNDGGEIPVTRAMKAHFWKLYYQSVGAIQTRKDGERRKNKHNRRTNDAAEFYHAMALKPVGSKIKIPQRRFIGNHPEFEKLIKNIVIDNFKKTFLQ